MASNGAGANGVADRISSETPLAAGGGLVDVTPTEDEREIQSMARSFFADRAPITKQMEAAGAGAAPGVRTDLLKEMAELDLFGQLLDVEAGGLGLSPRASGLIAEAAGRELVPGAWLDQLVAVVLCAGDTELAGSLTSARLIASVQFAAAGACDLRLGDGRAASGSISGLRNGEEADRWVVTFDDGVAVFDATALRGSAEPEHSIDPLWSSVSVSLDGVEPIAWLEADAALARRALAFANGLVAAYSLGASARLLDDTVAYVTDRKQFGRPIGSFQAIKHKAADCWTELLHARSLTYAALEASASAEASHELRAARIVADRCYRRIAEASLQMHGGIGFTSESEVHLFLKGAQQLRGWPVHVDRDLDAVRAELRLDLALGG